MRLIPRDEALQLLVGYLRVLDDLHNLSTPDLQRLAVTHVYDLAALVIGASSESACRRSCTAAGVAM